MPVSDCIGFVNIKYIIFLVLLLLYYELNELNVNKAFIGAGHRGEKPTLIMLFKLQVAEIVLS